MWKTTKLALAGTGVAFIILMFGVVGYTIYGAEQQQETAPPHSPTPETVIAALGN